MKPPDAIQTGSNTTTSAAPGFQKGRGAGSNSLRRFLQHHRETDSEFLEHLALEGESRRRATTVTPHPSRSIISRNQSPDLPFEQSINPYLGCEHGCSYCYARPTHAYLGLSPGLDFETRIFAKNDAAELLRAELNRPGYRPAMIALGSNTDPYQPAERELLITRDVLSVLEQYRLPVAITTKSALVVRDIDILARMAERGLARVYLSIGSLDSRLSARMEPRANAPARRLEAIRRLAGQGIPVGVFTSPLVPGLNDTEMEAILAAAHDAGARYASYVILRLPLEVRDLFTEWLEHHYPMRAARVMKLVREMRGGRDYDADFRFRMRGAGPYARLIAERFRLAVRRHGLNTDDTPMDASGFTRPASPAAQPDLFD